MFLFVCTILVSIFYLLKISQYNLYDFNTIHKSTNWFIHPYNGGVCIFGQLMALLTSILLCCILCIALYIKTYHWNKYVLYILAFSWVVFPFLMNNNWLSIMSIPLAILWIIAANQID